jgi:hypothetical protein
MAGAFSQRDLRFGIPEEDMYVRRGMVVRTRSPAASALKEAPSPSGITYQMGFCKRRIHEA